MILHYLKIDYLCSVQIKKNVSNKVIIISNLNELVRVRPERIGYIESDSNYSTMVLHDKMESNPIYRV